MAVRRLDLHPAALAELKLAVEWYLERSEPAAKEFAAEIDRAVDLIIESPARWPSGDHSTRRFILKRFPFALIYRERLFDIQLIAVAHGNRRPGYWTDRL